MTIHVQLLGECDVRLWGMTPRQRLERTLRGLPEARLADPGESLPVTGPVLLLRADYVYDERVLRGLLNSAEVALQAPRDGTTVAARGDARRWNGVARLTGQAIADLPVVSPNALAKPLQAELRKFDPPWVAPVSAAKRRQLENALFRSAYKNVTDFVTRCVWPTPARWTTRLCVAVGLRPNHVTAASYVLAFLAGWWFWQGAYGWGLLAAWVMTFLDTVDGKLARVTLSSSRFGDIFDHALDLVHPPLWYLAWAMGLGLSWQIGLPLGAVLWALFAGYVGGRLCEGVFKFAASFSLFLWRPFDSLNRLVTARRNPNLLILTVAWLAGRSDIGLLLVAAWTLISTAVLAARALWGLVLRRRGHDLQPWLSRIDPQADAHRPLVRMFALASGPADV